MAAAVVLGANVVAPPAGRGATATFVVAGALVVLRLRLLPPNAPPTLLNSPVPRCLRAAELDDSSESNNRDHKCPGISEHATMHRLPQALRRN